MEHLAIRQMWSILGPWPGNSPDRNPIENLLSVLKRWVDKQNPQILTYSKHWLCRNGLPSVRMWPRSWLKAYQGEMKRSWMRRVNTVNMSLCIHLNAIVNKSHWHLWNYCNYTSVYHSNIWKKWYKKHWSSRLCENEYLRHSQIFGHSCMQSLMLCFQASNVTLNLASRNFLPSLLNCNPSEIPRWDSKPPKSPLPKDDATSIRPLGPFSWLIH